MDCGFFRMSHRAARCCALLLLSLCVVPASGQEWARKMFSEFEHDFGTVARGSKMEHRFVITNVYKEDIVIESVTSSCGCTDVTLTKNVLKTWEKAEIIARFNTLAFSGFKQATVTVRFAPPFVGEVQLIVRGNIRSDVTFDPGKVDFGTIAQSQPAARSVRIFKLGNPNWRIVDVKSTFRHVRVSLSRPAWQNNQIEYEMTVKISEDAPPGMFRGELFIVADEGGRTVEIPLEFSGNVASPLQVSPNPLTVTSVVGEPISRKIILKADQEFSITGVRSSDGAIVVTPGQGSKRVHVVDVQYTPTQPGHLDATIEFQTDLMGGLVTKVDVVADIAEQDQ